MGAGKTFLARRLGNALQAPVFEMDLALDRDVVLGQQRWVSEGVYLWGVDPLLAAADRVVWLDVPCRTCLRRIVFRHFWLSAKGQNPHRGLRRLWKFGWAARRYWTTTSPRAPTGPTDWDALSRAQTLVVLAPYMDRVVQLRSKRAVISWIDQLSRRDDYWA